MRWVIILILMTLTGCATTTSLKECRKSCMIGAMKIYINEDIVCRCQEGIEVTE